MKNPFVSHLWHNTRNIILTLVGLFIIFALAWRFTEPDHLATHSDFWVWYGAAIISYLITNLFIIIEFGNYKINRWLILLNLALMVLFFFGQIFRFFDFFQAWPDYVRFAWGVPSIITEAVCIFNIFIILISKD